MPKQGREERRKMKKLEMEAWCGQGKNSIKGDQKEVKCTHS